MASGKYDRNIQASRGLSLFTAESTSNTEEPSYFLESSVHPCYLMDCTRFSVSSSPDDLFPALGLKAYSAFKWGQEQKALGKTTLVTVSSLRSSIPHITATVARYLGMKSLIVINELTQADVWEKSKCYPDCVAASDKGAVFLSALSKSLDEADRFAQELAAADPNLTIIPPGMHTQAVQDFSASLVRHLIQQPAITSLVTSVGSGWSLSGVIKGLLENNRSLHVVGVVVHTSELALLFGELGRMGITAVKEDSAIENYILSHGGWFCSLSILRHPEPLSEAEVLVYSSYFMKDMTPLDPNFEAKCVPVLEDLIASGYKPLFWNISCSPCFAFELKNKMNSVQRFEM